MARKVNKREESPIAMIGAGGVILLKEPRECRCGRMAMIVISRYGQTLCIDCNEKLRAGRGRN